MVKHAEKAVQTLKQGLNAPKVTVSKKEFPGFSLTIGLPHMQQLVYLPVNF